MITYLPELYPDELVYSWFCRYYAHSGYLTHKSALEDILYKRHNNPSKEFLGRLSSDMTEAIKRKYSVCYWGIAMIFQWYVKLLIFWV